MQTKQIAVAVAAAAAIVTLGACSSPESNTQSSNSAMTSVPSSMNENPPDTEAHNDADVMFAQGMIPHHQQAVEMSDMLLGKEGIDPRVVSLAEKIKNDQVSEIETMRGWLDDWGVTPMPPMGGGTPSDGGMPGMPGHDMSGDGGMNGMPGHGSMHGMSGQGMMSPADMAALQNAQGIEASRLFLTQMIVHHEGAISMSQHEIDNGQNAAAIEMARVIASSQQEEIASMQQLLQSL